MRCSQSIKVLRLGGREEVAVHCYVPSLALAVCHTVLLTYGLVVDTVHCTAYAWP